MGAHQSIGGSSLVQRLDGGSSAHVSHAICWSDMDLLEPTQIQHHPWHNRRRPPHQATAATDGDHRDPVGIGKAYHRRHLRGMFWAHHAQWLSDCPARHTPWMERIPR